jgi:hypothetical protein
MGGIAGRDYEKRRRQRVRRPVGRDLALLHGFEQRALRLGGCAVDFIGEHELREDRSLVKLEAAAVAMEHGNAEHIGGEQIARELNALIGQTQRFGEGMRQSGLADSRQVLDEQMAAREQAGHAEFQLPVLADDDTAECVQDQRDGCLLIRAAAGCDQCRSRHGPNGRLKHAAATPRSRPFVNQCARNSCRAHVVSRFRRDVRFVAPAVGRAARTR